MKNSIFTSILASLILLIYSSDCNSCTTFSINKSGQLIFGRNFDFPTGYGHINVNQRNVSKTAMIQAPEKPMQWVSKYGSITFNQAGRELPYGGINEKGLVIEQMWLQEVKYPETDNRYGLTELQWIQYQLDNSTTLKDVISSDSVLRISNLSMAPLHFLVCDKEGNAATIEYINGKMTCHLSKSLLYTALANDTYEKSLEYVKKFTEFGGTEAIPNTPSSLDRFARAACMVKNYNNKQNIIDYSFSILDSVSQGEGTRWSIVYDIKNMTVYFKTYNNKTIRTFKVANFDFSCKAPLLFIDIDENMVDNKLEFQHYSTKGNRQLIENVFNNVDFLKQVPSEARDLTANYPESLICNE